MKHSLVKRKTMFIFKVSAICLLAFAIGLPAYSEVIQTAIVATGQYPTGAHSVISVDPAGGPRDVENNLLPTDTSDIVIDAYGGYFYRIERYQRDNITKFDVSAPQTPIWQFSTLDSGEEGTSNPYKMIFVSHEKAYLLRYGKTNAWIVNPSATTVEEFKIGELDLSSYGDQDGLPEMNNGLIVNGELFITFQRLNRNDNWSRNTAYVAVFDTTMDTEIDTGISNPDNVKGIPLPITNPGSIQYISENNTIYIQGSGQFESDYFGTPAEYSGGITTLNPVSFQTSLLVDDGDEANHPYGNISGMVMVSSTKGYFVGYAGWGDNTLYGFNPTPSPFGVVTEVSNEYLKNKNISGMDSGAYTDQNGMVWVCNATDNEVVIVNSADDSIDEKISTELSPQSIVFCESVSLGYHVTPELWIRAVIRTEEKGDIEGVWKQGGSDTTAAGDQVIYGHFYASPAEVTWGSGQNPDLFVKIWFDHSGRVDVNFFHVSVPEIEVYSSFPDAGNPMEEGVATMGTRYIRHWYENGMSYSEEN